MELDQKCGSVLAYNQLDKKDMVTDPVIPNPPNHMKIHGREGLPKFNAQSLGKLPSTNLLVYFVYTILICVICAPALNLSLENLKYKYSVSVCLPSKTRFSVFSPTLL